MSLLVVSSGKSLNLLEPQFLWNGSNSVDSVRPSGTSARSPCGRLWEAGPRHQTECCGSLRKGLTHWCPGSCYRARPGRRGSRRLGAEDISIWGRGKGCRGGETPRVCKVADSPAKTEARSWWQHHPLIKMVLTYWALTVWSTHVWSNSSYTHVSFHWPWQVGDCYYSHFTNKQTDGLHILPKVTQLASVGACI